MREGWAEGRWSCSREPVEVARGLGWRLRGSLEKCFKKVPQGPECRVTE